MSTQHQEIYITDNHSHINLVKGIGPREIARRFKREGGKLLVIVSLLTWSLDLPPCEIESFEKLYKYTIEACRQVREEGVQTLCILGIHPAEIEQMLNRGWTRDQVLSFVEKCLNMVKKHIDEGRAHGVGEVGRPHWQVPEKHWQIHNEVLEFCLGYAKDLDVPVHLHLERKGEQTLRSIVEIVRKVGNRKYRVVLHHAESSIALQAFEEGLMPSISVGRREEFERALTLPPVYVVESDYLDDPRRPGAVIAPWALAKKVRQVATTHGLEYVRKLCVDNIVLTYGDFVRQLLTC